MSFFLETNISGKDLSLFKSINFKLSASCVSTAHITAVTNFLRVTPPESFNLHIQPIHFAYTRGPTKVSGKGEKDFFLFWDAYLKDALRCTTLQQRNLLRGPFFSRTELPNTNMSPNSSNLSWKKKNLTRHYLFLKVSRKAHLWNYAPGLPRALWGIYYWIKNKLLPCAAWTLDVIIYH